VLCGTCVASCGTVDGAYGPVRNPWRYQFDQLPQQADERALRSPLSTLRAERVSQHVRDYHVSTSSSSLTDCVHRDTDVSDSVTSDWFITGGSSGGSAVAVATGVAFA